VNGVHREEGAQALVLIAISLAALLLAVGLAVDTGQLYVARRAAQVAADSAAWAGAVELYGNQGASAARSAAIADAARNGYVITGADLDTPPVSGPTAGDASFIEVRITQQVSTFFFPGPRPVTVRAAGGSARSGSGHAVIVLRTGAVAQTLRIRNASATLDVDGSGIYVNSSDARAVSIDGVGPADRVIAPYTTVVGGVENGDEPQVSPVLTECLGACAAAADPFAALPPPSTAGLPTITQPRITGSVDLDEGVYVGGLDIDGGTATLKPGIYVLTDGGANAGLRVRNGGRIRMETATSGVLIFLTHANYPAAPGATPDCDRSLDVDTTGAVTLRAQGAGTYAGIVVYQDRDCPITTPSSRLRPTGATSLTGTIYLPNTRLVVSGGATLALTAQLVVAELWLEDAGTTLDLTFDPARVFGGRAPALTE
jgi:hypothetical protein